MATFEPVTSRTHRWRYALEMERRINRLRVEIATLECDDTRAHRIGLQQKGKKASEPSDEITAKLRADLRKAELEYDRLIALEGLAWPLTKEGHAMVVATLESSSDALASIASADAAEAEIAAEVDAILAADVQGKPDPDPYGRIHRCTCSYCGGAFRSHSKTALFCGVPCRDQSAASARATLKAQ